MARCSRPLTTSGAGESFEDAVLGDLCRGGGRGVVEHWGLLTGRINYPGGAAVRDVACDVLTYPSSDSEGVPRPHT